ncbi:flagellar hook-length control protein FliK, partial [Paenibacillus sp. 598K]|uniref:flagellar hook-length control protein FliK n=1 Tax=Paenibacillus sp. 598K TaxID=1117987 RepID=UPI0011CFB760
PQPLADRAAALADRAPGLPSGGPAGAAAAHAAEAGRPAAAQETLKGALLQLAARDDAPPALREAAQQLLQQVTGQQLLLSAERGGAMMSHLSIFIPLHAQDGNQTASVHIQTRRGRKGEIDASNCRLLFDLQMKQLGDTLVDVQVVDKIVSLTIWNDHPAIARLLETSRGQLAEAMTRSGYQLLTLRSTPLPSAEEREDAQAKKGALAGSAQLPDRGGYAAKPYRGVDLRA